MTVQEEQKLKKDSYGKSKVYKKKLLFKMLKEQVQNLKLTSLFH
jgi:hypothetical protein